MNQQVKLSAGVNGLLQDLMDTKVQLMLAREALAGEQARVAQLEERLAEAAEKGATDG